MCLCLLTYFSHFPGQASVDVIVQLQDGMSGVYDSNQPPFMSWLMARLTLPGMLGLNITLFGLAVLVLLQQLRVNVWVHNVVVLLLFCFPVIFVYNGIVWKDVLFANAALLGLLLLPQSNERLRWSSLIFSAAALALSVSVRQQGVLAAFFAVVYLVFTPTIFLSRVDRVNALAVWLSIYLCLSSLAGITVTMHGDTSQTTSIDGPLFQLATFDLGGILSHNPDIRFPTLEAIATNMPQANRPTRERMISALSGYRPDRQDFMAESIAASGVRLPKEALREDWRSRIIKYPIDYARHRIEFMGWLLGFHNIYTCSSMFFGISAEPAEMLEEIGMEPSISWRAQKLHEVSLKFVSLFPPYIYLAISISVLLILIYQGWRNSAHMILIQLAGLSYAASYFVVGISCDFRYTYFAILVSLFGLARVTIRSICDEKQN